MRLEPVRIDWEPEGITYALAPVVCGKRDCDTRLSAYNAGPHCWLHSEPVIPTHRVRSPRR